MSIKIPKHIEELSPYIPGRMIEDVARELGLDNIIKLASNENSLGASPLAVKAMAAALNGLNRYCDADSRALKQALHDRFGWDQASIVAGNGSSEFILVLAHSLLKPGDKAVMSKPSFTLYYKNVKSAGAEAVEAPLTAQYGHDLPQISKLASENEAKLVFLDNPLNPTGAFLTAAELQDFYESLPPETILILDEAYIEFARKERPDYQKLMKASHRLVVMRTFSKLYGLAGIRAAYAIMDPALAAAVNKVRQPFNLNTLAQVGAVAALSDLDFEKQSREMVWAGADFLKIELAALGFKVYPTEANFIMVDLGERLADDFYKALLSHGVISRSLSSFGLMRHLRVTVGLPEENKALVAAIKKII